MIFDAMKKLTILVAAYLCISAVTAKQCCDGDADIKPKGFCGNATERININCSLGHMLLKDVFVKNNRLYTNDAPEFSFASNPNDYCLGKMYRDPMNQSLGFMVVAVTCFQTVSDTANTEMEISAYLTLVSVVFLAATVAVYAYLPQLRDLQGLCYMCMCISMALGFMSLGVIQLTPGFRGEFCTVTGFLVYFWMIATFCWMNVICINVYRSVIDANYLKRTERRQYFYYSSYAWGASITLLIIALATNFAEGDHFKPGIGANSCWFQGRTETWIFFYGPAALLIGSNVILFILSSYQLWRQNRQYETSKLDYLKYKFVLSFKLFLVMGISWTFEIASFAHGEWHIVWKIMDTFNCLQGVIIFLLLVVLRKRAIKGFVDEGICLFCTRPLADKLNPHDDNDDQQILEEDHTEVRLN